MCVDKEAVSTRDTFVVKAAEDLKLSSGHFQERILEWNNLDADRQFCSYSACTFVHGAGATLKHDELKLSVLTRPRKLDGSDSSKS